MSRKLLCFILLCTPPRSGAAKELLPEGAVARLGTTRFRHIAGGSRG